MTGTLHTVGDRNVLRFERRLAHPVQKVWRAITEPEHLRHWFPALMEMELRAGGRIRFVFEHDEAPPLEGEISELDPPRLFEYTWDRDVLRWELRPEGDGCVLMFTYTFDDRVAAASFAAGWETCLDALAARLAGEPAPPASHVERHEAYHERFGLLEGDVEQTADGWRVRFERQFPYPIATVREKLTGDPWDADGVSCELSVDLGDMTRLVLTQSGPREPGEDPQAALAAWRQRLEALARQLRAGSSFSAL